MTKIPTTNWVKLSRQEFAFVDVGLHNNISPQFHPSQTREEQPYKWSLTLHLHPNFMQFYKLSYIYYSLISTLPFNIELKLTYLMYLNIKIPKNSSTNIQQFTQLN
jgi:hypothetical protein